MGTSPYSRRGVYPDAASGAACAEEEEKKARGAAAARRRSMAAAALGFRGLGFGAAAARRGWDGEVVGRVRRVGPEGRMVG